MYLIFLYSYSYFFFFFFFELSKYYFCFLFSQVLWKNIPIFKILLLKLFDIITLENLIVFTETI